MAWEPYFVNAPGARRNEPLTILGLNPRRRRRNPRKRRRKIMARKRHRRRNARRVVVVNDPRRRRRRTTGRRRNPFRRRRPARRHNVRHVYHTRYRTRSRNPRRHRRRHNAPARAGALRLTRPMTYLPAVFTGGVAAGVSALAPRVLGAHVTTMQAYAIQGGVALAGAMALPFIGFRGVHPYAWLVGAGAPIIYDLVVKRLMSAFGLSVYPYSALSQEPYYPPRLYAYPYQPGGYSQVFDYGAQERVGAPEAPFEHMYNN